MASLNLDLNYFDHPKTLRLMARLGAKADVLPIRLWAYVGKHQPESGRLDMTEAELERACRWWGKRGAMVTAMVDVGFLDQRTQTSFSVHDWLDHSGHLGTFKIRAQTAARKRWGMPEAQPSNASSNAKDDDKQCLKQCPDVSVLDVSLSSSTGLGGAAPKTPQASSPSPLSLWLKEVNGLTPAERQRHKDQYVAELMEFHLPFAYQDELIQRYFGEDQNASNGGKSVSQDAALIRRVLETQGLRKVDVRGFGSVLPGIRDLPNDEKQTDKPK